jgi:hypothetical protein
LESLNTYFNCQILPVIICCKPQLLMLCYLWPIFKTGGKMRAFGRHFRRTFLYAIALVTAGSSLAFFVPPGKAGADPECDAGNVYTLFARGSGAPFNSAEAEKFRNATSTLLNQNGIYGVGWAELGNLDGDYQVENGEYWAQSVPDWSNVTGSYSASVKTGADELVNHLNERALRSEECRKQPIILGGYSQGADVVGWALERAPGNVDYPALVPQARELIAYVALYGDPKFDAGTLSGRLSNQQPWWVRGDNPGVEFTPSGTRLREGVLGDRNPYAPPDFYGRFGSWCDDGDGICGAYQVFNMGTHTNSYSGLGQWIYQSAEEITSAALDKLGDMAIDAPSMYTASNGDIWIAGVAQDGELFTRKYTASSATWGPASSRGLNYATNSSPAITKASDGKIWLMAVKTNGDLQAKYFDSSWHNANGGEPISAGVSVHAGLRMVPRSSGQVTVLFVKTSGNIYHKTGDETGWATGGPHWSGNWSTTSMPALTLDSSGTMWAAAVKSGGSQDGHLYVWKIIPGDVDMQEASREADFNDFSRYGGVDLIGRSNGGVTVVAIDADGNFHHKTLSGDMVSLAGAAVHGNSNSWSIFSSPSITLDNAGDIWIAAIKGSGTSAYSYEYADGSWGTSHKINLSEGSFSRYAGLDLQPRTNGSVSVAGVDAQKAFVHHSFSAGAWGGAFFHFN